MRRVPEHLIIYYTQNKCSNSSCYDFLRNHLNPHLGFVRSQVLGYSRLAGFLRDLEPPVATAWLWAAE